MKYENIIANIKPWQLFVIAFCLAGLIAFIKPFPATDTINRYAPAAEAFASGDWKYAFHPRFGVFFTSFAGTITFITNLSGASACKIISALLFSLAVFPLYHLFRQIWKQQTAVFGILMYILCSHLLRYAAEGLRDNGKTLALALIACGLTGLLRQKSWYNCLYLAGGSALLTVIRGEGALIALLSFIWGMFLLHNDWKKLLFIPIVCLILVFPQLYYNYLTIGYPVPELRHAVLLDKMGIHFCDAPVKIPETAR